MVSLRRCFWFQAEQARLYNALTVATFALRRATVSNEPDSTQTPRLAA